jgi:structural maintenance of chromosome 1
MRNQRAGQATFIPLDTIQVKPINDKFRAFAKGARLAVDVIQYEPAMERAIHHACGNALVCDTMEVARYVCYEKDQEVKGTSCLTPRGCFTDTVVLMRRLRGSGDA